MTGETIRELLQPLIGKSGAISMVVSRTGHIGFVATGTEKLTGVKVRPDGLVHLERETVDHTLSLAMVCPNASRMRSQPAIYAPAV
jgi:hypothetical protein